MSSKAVQARLNFLNNSAHLLAIASPSTAAFLQYRVDELASGKAPFDPFAERGSPLTLLGMSSTSSTARYLDVCASCGSALTTLPLEFKTLHGDKGRPNKTSSSTEKSRRLYVECRSCYAKTYHDMSMPKIDQKARRRHETMARISSEIKTEHSDKKATDGAPLTATNASMSSRKRAKARKGNSLTAMLAKSKAAKESSSKGFGLDLMDLMKST